MRRAKAAEVDVPRIVGGEVVERPLDRYRPNDWNPNRMTEEERASLRAGLRRGWVRSQALLVWATDERGRKKDVIIDGEQKWEEARKLGFKVGPVVEMRRISRREAVELTIKLDKVRGTFDRSVLIPTLDRELDFGRAGPELAVELGFTRAEAQDLRVGILPDRLGAGSPALVGEPAPRREAQAGKEQLKDELAAFLAGAGAIADDGLTPTAALRRRWGTAEGQLWLVPSARVADREHRILCADARDSIALVKLMRGELAQLVHTDPPYGVALAQVKANVPNFPKNVPWADIEHDDLDGPELLAFLRTVIAAVRPHLVRTAAHYFWHPPMALSARFIEAMLAEGLLVHRQIIWDKGRMVFTRSGQYHWQHETCLYGWPKGRRSSWYGDKCQTSLWHARRDTDAGMHPTQKPCELFVRPIYNHTKPGDIVLEPFSGSGSQLCAAEHMGRLCYACEIDPGYVAVALERLAARGLRPRLADAA